MKLPGLSLSSALLCIVATACHRTSDVIPDRLEGRVDRHLRYIDIKDHPEIYRGKLMLAGGKVLSAKRTQDRIWIEVLQIPLSQDLIPTGPDSDSKGRFVIIDRGDQMPDSAALTDKEKRVTVVGEVLGTTTVQIGEVKQQVPELAVKHITVWDWDHMKGGYGRYYGYGDPFPWGYRGYYGGSVLLVAYEAAPDRRTRRGIARRAFAPRVQHGSLGNRKNRHSKLDN